MAHATGVPRWLAAHNQREVAPMKLHKGYASNYLRSYADQATREGWRAGARLPKSDLAFAGYANCIGRQYWVQDPTSMGCRSTPPGQRVPLSSNGIEVASMAAALLRFTPRVNG